MCNFLVGNIFATDLTMEQYEDSVAAAQKAEKIAASLPAPVPIAEKQEPAKVLSISERAVIDSFDLAYRQYEMQWNEVKRLRDVILIKDRIDALSFYLRKLVMSKTDVEKMALILQAEKQTEREGTLFLIAHQSGKEQVKAHAHLIKLRSEILTIENFLYALHNERIAIKN
jgi:hypothetical protein